MWVSCAAWDGDAGWCHPGVGKDFFSESVWMGKVLSKGSRGKVKREDGGVRQHMHVVLIIRGWL